MNNMTMGFYFVIFIGYSALSLITIGILLVCLLKTKSNGTTTRDSKPSLQGTNKPKTLNRETPARKIDPLDDEAKGYIQPMARLNNSLCNSPHRQHTGLDPRRVYDDVCND